MAEKNLDDRVEALGIDEGERHDQFTALIAHTIVWMVEGPRDYPEHIDALAEISIVIGHLERSGRAWRDDVEKAIHRELVVDRQLV